MNNIKYVVFGMLIFLILFFFVGIVNSHINRNLTIRIKEYDNFESDMKELSTKIDKVKKEECRSSLKYMYDRIVENNLKGEVKLKDYYSSFYKDDLTFVDYYNYASSSCDINDNEIYIKAMSTMVYPEYIKNKYNRAYEFNFIDKRFNDNNFNDMGTYSTLVNEMYVLSDLLKELS